MYRLIVDTSQFIHAAWWVHKKGDFQGDIVSKVIQLLENQIFKLEIQAPASSVVLALDSKPNFRVLIDPKYKNRPDSGIPLEEITTEIRRKFNTLECPLMEADDIIYLYCATHSPKDKVVILSSDKDQYQTTAKTGAYQWCPNLGHRPNDGSWEHKVYLGCLSDNIPKSLARGVGLSALLKVFPDHTSLKMDNSRYLLNKELVEYSQEIYLKYIDHNNLSALLTTIKSL